MGMVAMPNLVQEIVRFRRYLVIEPFFFFYIIPSVLNLVAMRNFPLEKACRVNLGYSKDTCMAMRDKSAIGIDCDAFSFENTTNGAHSEQYLLGIDSADFNYTVCKAAEEAQNLVTDVSSQRDPIAAIIPLIILLFAGSWADRYNKLKPCLIMPIVGEALSFTCLLISAIFFDSLPTEFGMYLESIVPAICGGLTLSLMAIFSYIAIDTPENDRATRFSIFAIFVLGVPLLIVFSGLLFNLLGYIVSFASAVVFQIIAILYIIFFIKEIKPQTKTVEELPASRLQSHAVDNLAYERTNQDELSDNKNVNFQLSPQLEPAKVDPPPVPVKRSLLKEFFDPRLAMDCLRFLLVKRTNHGRMLLLLMILASFLFFGPSFAESDPWSAFTAKQLGWQDSDYNIYETVTGLASLVCNLISTFILSNMYFFSDSALGIISAIANVCSHVVLAFSTTTASFYLATAIDLFANPMMIIRTIASTIVKRDELGTMFSIFGIFESLCQLIFPPIFRKIHKNTVNSFAGAIFLFGEIFYVPNVLVFVLCYFVLRRRTTKEERSSEKLEQNNSANGTAITRL